MKIKLILIFIFILSCAESEKSSLITGATSSSQAHSLSIGNLEVINANNEQNYLVNGTCQLSVSPVEITVNNGELSASTTCLNYTYLVSLDVSSLSDSESEDIEISSTEQDVKVTRLIAKDTTSPSINQIQISGNTYKAGDFIELRISFDEVILVENSPSVELILNSQSQSNIYFEYVSGSSTQELLFRYLVTEGDVDSDGITLASSLSFDNGLIEDANGNRASESLGELTFSNVLVDSQAPVVESFIEPVNATYANNGGELVFQVNYSEAVVVSGVPRLVLDIGGSIQYANYVSGTGTTGLEFKYLVMNSDEDLDGISMDKTSIDLNSGTIKSSFDSDNAALSFSSSLDSLVGVIVNTSSGIIAPDQVSGVSTAPTTSNSALSLAWSAPSDNGTEIINYAVQYRLQNSTSWINTPSSSTTTTTVEGLIAGETYEFRVAANNGLLGAYSVISNAEIFDILSLNPIAWLSATNVSNGGVEPSDGSKVAVWKDLTGVATEASETDPSKQPTFETNVQNGLPAVKFDGTLSRGLEGSFERTNNGGLTIFVVGKFSGTARRAFFEFYKTGGGTSPGSARGFFFTYGFNNASSNYNLNNSEFNVWSAYDSGTNTDFWENGNLVYSNWSNWGNTSFTGSGSYVLGDDQTGGDQLDGYLGEFLIFDRKLTPSEMSTLETYLKNKWGTL